jgi:hypothetical protein
VNISEKQIPERLNTYNADTTSVRMVWSDIERGFYVFLTPLAGGATTNYFYDVRNQSWWPDKFATAAQNPVSVHLFDGDTAADRTVLLGGQDGYVRKFDYTSFGKSDDGVAIDSYVFLGPIQLKNRPKLMLTDLKAAMATGSSDVDFTVYSAETAELAEGATSAVTRFTGAWSAGRNKAERRRAVGHDIYVKIRNDDAGEGWAFEFLGVEVNSFSGPRARQW